MRLLLLLLTVAACAPQQQTPTCQPGSCPAGQHCVFRTAAGEPTCTPACDGDGGCATGSCTCARYSTATQDCVQVCR